MSRKRGSDTERRELEYQVGAARAHERDSGARHREEADVDSNMDSRMRSEEEQHDEREQRVEVGRRGARHLCQTRKEQRVDEEQKHHADEAPLLSKRREDKVSLVLGQEAELTLGAVAHPFPQELAATHRYLGL